MLFRDELYTLEDVMAAAEKNPDVLWVIHEAAPGSYNTDKFVSMGKMPAKDIVTKYGWTMKKATKTKILQCAAKKEQKEHPWASPTLAMRIATDHGVKEYPECIMTIREGKRK